MGFVLVDLHKLLTFKTIVVCVCVGYRFILFYVFRDAFTRGNANRAELITAAITEYSQREKERVPANMPLSARSPWRLVLCYITSTRYASGAKLTQ